MYFQAGDGVIICLLVEIKILLIKRDVQVITRLQNKRQAILASKTLFLEWRFCIPRSLCSQNLVMVSQLHTEMNFTFSTSRSLKKKALVEVDLQREIVCMM